MSSKKIMVISVISAIVLISIVVLVIIFNQRIELDNTCWHSSEKEKGLLYCFSDSYLYVVTEEDNKYITTELSQDTMKVEKEDPEFGTLFQEYQITNFSLDSFTVSVERKYELIDNKTIRIKLESSNYYYDIKENYEWSEYTLSDVEFDDVNIIDEIARSLKFIGINTSYELGSNNSVYTLLNGVQITGDDGYELYEYSGDYYFLSSRDIEQHLESLNYYSYENAYIPEEKQVCYTDAKEKEIKELTSFSINDAPFNGTNELIVIDYCSTLTGEGNSSDDRPNSGLSEYIKVIAIPINSGTPSPEMLFTELKYIEASDILVDYSKVDFSEVGKYDIIITVFDIDYPSRIEIVDVSRPNLVVNEVTIKKGERYTANDFVTSCDDDSKKECIISFDSTTLDYYGNIIDMSSYTEVGTYDIRIVASDHSKNTHVIETVLNIIE